MRVNGCCSDRTLVQAFIVSLIFFFVLSKAFSATGTQWLATQVNPDGSYASASDISPSFQATSEVLQTFEALGVSAQQPGVNAALQFISSETYHNTENLARKIIALHAASQDVSALIIELVAMQNRDGGFGELAGYDSSVFDTAFALQALNAAGVTDSNVIGNSVSYLVGKQDNSGGYTLGEQNEISIYITSQVSLSLQPYLFTFSVGNTIDAASEFMFSQQLQGGGWQTIWESAYALLAVMPVTTESSRYAKSVEVLQAAQTTDGSWDADVYTTALAVRVNHQLINVQLPVNPLNGVFTGRIFNNVTSLPLSGAIITLDQLPAMQAQSAVDGSFSLNDVTPGQYTVRYQLAGYFEVTQVAAVQAGQLVSLGSVTLTPLPDVGVVMGVITDSQTGAPLAGVQIQVVGVTNVSATTDATGRYSVAVAPGTAMITASLIDYDSVSGAGTVVAGKTLQFSPSMNPSGTPVADPAATVKGSIIDAESLQPLAGVLVDVIGTVINGSSDSAGIFTLTGITAGELVIDVSLAGYQTVRYMVVAPEGSIIDLGTIHLPKVTAATSSTVTGIITDAGTATPVVGANITIEALGVGAISDADGNYRIENLATTQFIILASAVGYLKSSGDVQLPQAGLVTVNFQLQPAGASDFNITQVDLPQPSYPALSEVPLTATLSNSGTALRNVRLYVKAILFPGSRPMVLLLNMQLAYLHRLMLILMQSEISMS